MVVMSLRPVASAVVRKRILQKVCGLRLSQFEVCSANWRMVLQGLACLTVSGISPLSAVARAEIHLLFKDRKVFMVPIAIRLALVPRKSLVVLSLIHI